MKLSKLTILSFIFSSISIAMFLSLKNSQNPPTAILSLSAALVFFAMAVMSIIESVDKRHADQLKQPVQIGSVAFALTGAAGAGRSLYLGILTGAWEYWALVTNMVFFVVGVLLFWYNRFITKMLSDVKEK